MLEQLKYKNHVNEVIEFGKNGIYVDMSDIHDHEWSVSKKNNRIASLEYAISKRKLPVIIICGSEEEGIAARNRLFEVAEKDVLAMQYGRIIIGGYYFKCYVTKSKKDDYLLNKGYMRLTLTLTTDFPFWVKESAHTFLSGGRSSEGGTNLDFAYDFPIDYHSDSASETLNNSGFVPANFRLIIYGACENPAVYIAGHAYQVNCSVGANEYLTIDSTTKKVYLVANDGTVTNKFSARNRESYIFEKIPPGANAVTWPGGFGFDVILLEERSEPKWI